LWIARGGVVVEGMRRIGRDGRAADMPVPFSRKKAIGSPTVQATAAAGMHLWDEVGGIISTLSTFPLPVTFPSTLLKTEA